MAPDSEGIFRFLPTLEQELELILPASDDSSLGRAMRYAVIPGGKRIRPLLCLASWAACRGQNKAHILPFACGIELIHAFSLVQDDLPAMDNDLERRGRPSLHAQFGEATALLASDALYSLAFELFAQAPLAPSRRIAAIREIARAVGARGIIKGQLEDIDGTRSDDSKALRRIHRLKTAGLIAVSLKIGALVAGARKRVCQALEAAGVSLGMLFQLTDDLLDQDERPTYVTHYGRSGTLFRAQRYYQRYLAQLGGLGAELTPSGLRDLRSVGRLVLERRR
ncbi:MAG: polyprenyl synthetase family protein [candidate division WOR-3 bacterium]